MGDGGGGMRRSRSRDEEQEGGRAKGREVSWMPPGASWDDISWVLLGSLPGCLGVSWRSRGDFCWWVSSWVPPGFLGPLLGALFSGGHGERNGENNNNIEIHY